MSELTFKQYADAIISNADILTDDEIIELWEDDSADIQALVLQYVARIAVHCVEEMRRNSRIPNETDETDLIDAAQECSLYATQIVDNWYERPRSKLSTYASVACRRIASDYLWTVVKGGTDYGRGQGLITKELPEADETLPLDDMHETELWVRDLTYENPPLGYDDPLAEVIALQETEQRLRVVNAIPGRPGKRARKKLGLR